MSAICRGIIVISAALLLLILAAVTVHAQSWSSTVTCGVTSVCGVFSNGTYSWSLRNLTSLPGDNDPTYDVPVWELIPYQVQEPLSWIAPAGWTWTGDRWALTSSPSRKYFTPGALGPGESIDFTYTPDPDGALINVSGPQPDGRAFVAHVGAVVPGSGSPDGTRAWTPASTSYGPSWFDRSSISISEMEPVTEPKSIAAMALCLLGTIGVFTVQSRRSSRGNR